MANRDNSSTRPEGSPATGSVSAARTRSGWKVHLLTFGATVVVVWIVGAGAYIFFSPWLIYTRAQNAMVQHGLGGSSSPGIPINTLYTQPTLASPSSSNNLESTENRDTLYTVGWLDLSKGPMVLYGLEMGYGRIVTRHDEFIAARSQCRRVRARLPSGWQVSGLPACRAYEQTCRER